MTFWRKNSALWMDYSVSQCLPLALFPLFTQLFEPKQDFTNEDCSGRQQFPPDHAVPPPGSTDRSHLEIQHLLQAAAGGAFSNAVPLIAVSGPAETFVPTARSECRAAPQPALPRPPAPSRPVLPAVPARRHARAAGACRRLLPPCGPRGAGGRVSLEGRGRGRPGAEGARPSGAGRVWLGGGRPAGPEGALRGRRGDVRGWRGEWGEVKGWGGG